MSLNENFVGQVRTSLQNGKTEIGTAYAIRQGMIITAAHVIPNIETYNDNDPATIIRWEVSKDEKKITKIPYYSTEYDIAVAKCETPANTPNVIFSKEWPESDQHWDTFGYALSAKNVGKKIRELESASGTYIKSPENKHIQQLNTTDHIEDAVFWRGISGAPIFTTRSDQITAIIVKTSTQFVDENGKEEPHFKNRLSAVSIAYLLDKENKFSENINPQPESFKYREAYQEYSSKKQEEIKQFTNDNKKLNAIIKLGDTEDLIRLMRDDPVECIFKLIETITEDTSTQECEVLQKLFHLLISQIPILSPWNGEHYHEVEVSTHLYAELLINSRYQGTPTLEAANKNQQTPEVIGKGAIAWSVVEVGFDPKANAIEQAKNLAHAIFKETTKLKTSLTEFKLQINRLEENKEDNKPIKTYFLDRITSKFKMDLRVNKLVNRLEINKNDPSTESHPFLDPPVIDYFRKKLLPTFPVIVFGSDIGHQNEAEVYTYVDNLLEKILQCKQNHDPNNQN